ncbi:MAG: site-specific integrase [Acidobacteria bacterium]|nr:site-specific integrase [Acidobacteriota bacterium]
MQSNRREAQSIESAYRTKLAKGEVGIDEPKPVPTFGAAMKDFLKWSEQEHAAHPNTHKRYENSSKALLRFFGDVPLDRITPDDVEKFKTWRIKQQHRQRGKKPTKQTKVKKRATAAKPAKTLKPATVNRELACLKILLNYFIKSDVLTKSNPVSRVKFFAENNEQMRVLTFDEAKLYLLAATQPLRDVATLMLETGMRPEEVCRIRRENVHLAHDYLFNPYGKTNAAKRKIPLTEKAAEVLRRRLTQVKGDYLFQGRGVGDAPLLKVNNAHTATVRRCGVRAFRLYDLRHTWATRAAMAGVDLVTLAAMIGHSRVQMVMRYAHPTEEHQFQAMKKMQTYMAGSLRK